MTTSILDLANELLIEVCELLDDDDLYSLSIASTRLHHMALQTIIFRHGGTSRMEEYTLLSGPPFALLPALRLALFIRKLRRVVVIFNDGSKQQIIRAMIGLERFLHQMTHVKQIFLNFSWVISPKTYPDDFLEVLENVFMSLAGKACVHLELDGCLFEGSAEPTQKPQRDLPPLTTLRSFSFYTNNSQLLAASLRLWIIDSINLSPITDLILHGLASSSGDAITSIFPFLTIPSLSTLRLVSTQFDLVDLFAFFGRHPSLQHLFLTANGGRVMSSTVLFKVGALPALSNLDISPHLLCHFLTVRDSLPNLQALTLRPSIYAAQNSSWHLHVEECLTDLAPRRNITTLKIQFPCCAITEKWLTGERRNLERSLKFVTTVIVGQGFDCEGFTLPMEPLFVQWLSLFPVLEHANFEYLWGDAGASLRLVNAIAQACPQIKKVTIGCDKYEGL